MKLKDIIFEYGELDGEAKLLQQELDKKFPEAGRIIVSMGNYSAGREDDDPRKDMSYGQVQFMVTIEYEDAEWNEMVSYIKDKGYTITQDSNYADEDPGERRWYPSIKFDFKRENI